MPGGAAESAPVTLAQLQRLLDAHGLRVHGAFAMAPDDCVPRLAAGIAARTLVLVGNVGSSLWPAFQAAAEAHDGLADPLDRWSRRIGEHVAARLGAEALYPFGGPPHHPFQHWAARAEAVHPSPLRLMIHPVYGLWHAYRFALLLAEIPPDLPARARAAAPCASCEVRPCLAACPVDAFSDDAFRVERCLAHLRAHPEGACAATGCLARLACPIGMQHRYRPAHARFHMRAFVHAQPASSRGT